MSETIMAVKVEDVNPVKKKLSFDVPWDDVKKEMDAVYREVSRTAKVKGFRKGKVPRNILETLYKEYAETETITKLIERLYFEALQANAIMAVNHPDIEQGQGIEHEKNFTFVATVEVAPVIEPRGYTDLALEKIERDVTEKDVEAKLEEYRRMFATMDEIQEDRGIKEGDFITLDFAGKIDGVSKKELSAEGFFLEVGAKRFIPGFEEQLIGVVRGEPKEINLKFPDDYYAKDVAGKDAVFNFTVKNIKEQKLPPLDSSFIENFDTFGSIEELKDDIRQKLTEQNKARSQNDLRNLTVTELLKVNEFEVPECYVEREYQYMMADTKRRMAMEGLDKDAAAGLQAKFQDQYRQGAIRMVKVASLLDSIARKEGITVEDSELQARIDEMATQSRNYDTTKKYLEKEEIKANLSREILHNKIFKFIEDHAQIKVVKEDKDMDTKGVETT
ncbi:MAG: trigger factor [Deltaproteobacteria bacterium]|nr:trigger factor [Deltaproteobacteria bacterium]